MTELAGTTIELDVQPPAGLLIDTHCHLDDQSFREDLSEVLAESMASGVRSWINVGFEPERWDSTLRLVDRFPGMSCMLGIHPTSATAYSGETLDRMRRLLLASDAVAIGEIGLDLLRERETESIQRQAFEAQLDLALELRLPVVIHMRDAEAEMLSVLAARPTLPPLLFHSFDGGPALTEFILASGAYVGVGGLATRQKSESLRAELQKIPLQRMVLETDSPYLVPARQKARRNTPAQIRTIASFLATLLAIDEDQVVHTTTINAWSYFGRLPIA
ncbi:MAG TPA: TatD family hydrolase [Thermomicrobiales bacterium]|nr:TatD family hydrolase [Thermomicrobiales bacterium]